MFDTEVLNRTKIMEALLKNNFGASGRGLGKQLKSVKDRIDSQISRKIRRIVIVRNKLAHETDYVFEKNPIEFIAECDDVIQYLKISTKKENEVTPPIFLSDYVSFCLNDGKITISSPFFKEMKVIPKKPIKIIKSKKQVLRW